MLLRVGRLAQFFKRGLYLIKSNKETESMVRILNVAEKNDAAKSLSDIMSAGRYSKREGLSKYNKIYEFPYRIMNQNAAMVMTSVSGHLLNFEFVGQYKNWRSCHPVDLFEAEIIKYCPPNYCDIKKTLEREIRNCQILIVWTDCDREGENIGFEVIQVCTAVKPDVKVYRARFSEITQQAITRAINNLVAPDHNTNDAVDVRQQLDLRIGAAFTRFQTLRLQQVFPSVLADQLVSYGSCQFPTLGFVVERYKQVQAFVAEPFWKIQVSVLTESNEEAEFVWKRQRLFDYLACLVLYQHCIERPEAKVISVVSKPKSKWRPLALDTVELEKTASRKLRIGAKETMRIAELLYNRGFISYPRTETNAFPKDFDLRGLIQQQTQDGAWGAFATDLLAMGPNPRNGTKSDQAHPPIHPIKYTNTLQGNEKIIYEFVVRHFLACCSRDALGQETTVEIDINDERFTLSGLMIIARNYLDVYPYDKWNGKVIPVFQVGEVFQPISIQMTQGETSPPSLLTEADLIGLMEKHGIGTDATHAEHIETIKARLYVGVRPDGKFVPGELGMGLVEGYDAMGYEMSKPNLRSELEADLQRICEGRKDKNAVLEEQIQKYKAVFIEACKQASKIDEALSQFFGDAKSVAVQELVSVSPTVRPCPLCGSAMVLKKKKDNVGVYLSCLGYPDCRNAVWFPASVLDAEMDESVCDMCNPGTVHKIRFKFKRGSVPPNMPLELTACIGGCDAFLNETLGITNFRSSRGSSEISTNSSNRTSSSTRSDNRSSNAGSSSAFFSNYPTTSSSSAPPQNARNVNAGNRQPLGAHNGPRMMQGNTDQRWRSASDSTQWTGRPGNSGVPRTDGSGSSNDRVEGQSPVCQCGDDARLMTVKKEGPNTGRQFYSCPRPQDGKCGFFLWANTPDNDTGDSSRQQFNAGRNNNTNINAASSGPVMFSHNQPRNVAAPTGDAQCKCGIPAKLCTVAKDGPNKGRSFHGCSKPRNEGCNFFAWADEPGQTYTATTRPQEGQVQSGFRGGTFGNTNTRGRGRKRPQSSDVHSESGRTQNKRKCGICGEEGHTKKTCPSR